MKRSVMKKSVLNIVGSSDVLNPMRDSTPFEIKPTIGSPIITKITTTLFSHQGISLPPQSRTLSANATDSYSYVMRVPSDSKIDSVIRYLGLVSNQWVIESIFLQVLLGRLLPDTPVQ